MWPKATEEFSLVVSSVLPGNCQRKMPICRCTLRKRATRRSDWVAPTKSFCGVFKRASWALECLPPSRPFIDRPLVPLHPPDNSPSLDECPIICLSHSVLFFFCIFNLYFSSCGFWLDGTEDAPTPLTPVRFLFHHISTYCSVLLYSL